MKNQAEVHDLLLEIAATITKLANAIGEDDLHGKSHYDEWYEKLKQDEAAMRSEVQTDRELLSPYITPSPGPFYTPTTPRPMKPLMVDELGEAAAYHWREARELTDKLPMPDPKEWEEWGRAVAVDPAVLDYLKNYPEEDKD